MANWDKILSRGKVEDRRSFSPVAVGKISLVGVATFLIMNYLSGGSIEGAIVEIGKTVLQQQVNQVATQENTELDVDDSYAVFASTVLGSNNQFWNKQLQTINREYREPKLVLFRVATDSACGIAASQIGPHYCSLDKTIYLDETFFDEMIERFGAQGGDVAQAYVIAHEVGHHVQNVMEEFGQKSSIEAELQADCYAGAWANSLKDQGVLEPGEIREAMDAAAAIGDDRIQEKTQGYANPETFTHGSSEEREKWFTIGYEQGTIRACDTTQN